MELRNVSTTSQALKPVTFKARQSEAPKREYIDRAASSRAATGALFGNILGGWLIGIPAARAILKNPLTREALKSVPPLRALAASLAVFASAAIPAFLAARFLVNKGRPEEQKISDKSLVKLTAASMIGTSLGGMAGNVLQNKLGQGIMPMLANAIVTVFGNDAAVNMMAKNHNKKAEAPQYNYMVVSKGPMNAQDFQYFIARTQNNQF